MGVCGSAGICGGAVRTSGQQYQIPLTIVLDVVLAKPQLRTFMFVAGVQCQE